MREPEDRWIVSTGTSLYMCGHGVWYVREAGRPGIVASFTCGVIDARRLENVLNGRDPRHREDEDY